MTSVYKTHLKRITQLSPLYYECVFEKPVGFTYQAGQYCELGTIDDSLFRPFSIASAPHEDELVFHIKKNDNPKSLSHQLIIAGASSEKTYMIKPAQGNMCYNSSQDPLIFIAGGVGFAPFYAILKSLHHTNQTKRPIAFYWECKSEDDFYHKEALETLLADFENSALTTTISAHKTTAGAVIDDFNTLSDCDIYIAGSPDMAFKTIDLLKTIGLEDTRLYCDYIQNHKL